MHAITVVMRAIVVVTLAIVVVTCAIAVVTHDNDDSTRDNALAEPCNGVAARDRRLGTAGNARVLWDFPLNPHVFADRRRVAARLR